MSTVASCDEFFRRSRTHKFKTHISKSIQGPVGHIGALSSISSIIQIRQLESNKHFKDRPSFLVVFKMIGSSATPAGIVTVKTNRRDPFKDNTVSMPKIYNIGTG